jgi:hypothetical protein
VAIIMGTGGLALLTGCGGENPAEQQAPVNPQQVLDSGPAQKPVVAPDAQQQAPDAGPVSQQLVKYWWPGFMMKNGQLVPVYLGYGEDTFYNKSDLYPYKERITAVKKITMRGQIDGVLNYSNVFFTDKKMPELLDGYIIMKFPGSAPFSGGVGGTNCVMVVDGNGAELPQFSGGANVVSYANNNNGGVLFHEFLHIAFDKMSPSDIGTFKQQATAFFNAYDDNASTDRLYPLLLGGNNGSFVLSSAVRYWAQNNIANLSPAEQQTIMDGLRYYINIHANVVDGKTKDMTPDLRSGFINFETFAPMGAYYPALDAIAQGRPVPYEDRHIPAHMDWFYMKAGLKDDPFNNTLTNTGAGFFTSDDQFKQFTPYLKSFVDWMLNLYPALKAASQ